MPKTKLQEHDRYSFECALDVRVSDLNYGAHLGYDRILGMAHQARLEMFREMGVDETDLGDGKTGIVASDVVVNYLGEAFVHDTLSFEIMPVEVGPISFRLAHRITRRQDGARVALVEIGFVGFDYSRRSMSRLVPAFKEGLERMASG